MPPDMKQEGPIMPPDMKQEGPPPAAAAAVSRTAAAAISPIDARAPGLKRPSEVLKQFLLCVTRMAKKPLSVVRGMAY
jgi:hypothetical protein